ncbi:threonine synthase-like 2 isoform X2 [Choloepus didactylus]|uniref:threonine synthase-like 2 isoform X2 n=1 Tax=Choloepus didactylus TaxID=27675 RepID=UPI00189D9DB3|nr:threonine synthase-like 2 isoform X2 [Choloepus didactylus]
MGVLEFPGGAGRGLGAWRAGASGLSPLQASRTMWYVSTRGVAPPVDFEGALFSGYAPDGGLFVPEELPQLDRETLRQWSTLSYPGLVKELCSLFIGPELIPRGDLDGLIDRAFSRFRHREVVHLSRLRDGLNVLELWHGPTYAFKDLSLSCTAQFLQYFLEKREKHVTVVVGTSGDTGSAAIESVQGAKNVDIIVLLPKGHCSKIQELQMTTVLNDNVHVFGVEGNSDELDEPIKAVFADVAFVQKHSLMSLNSINWSRVLVQIAHHFFAYFRCAPSLDTAPLPPVEVIVPTGAAGNLAAGCIAQNMGLPIRLVAAVNRNDIIHRTLQQGDFSLSEAVQPTWASAMDIQVPYNMERIFWLLSGSDSQGTRTLMEQFEITQGLRLPKELHEKLSGAVTSESVSDETITQTMIRCWDENRYVLCPHSAVAVSHHYQQQPSLPPALSHSPQCTPRCCLAPASAAKFSEAVQAAGLPLEAPAEILALEHKETRCTPMPRGEDWALMLRNTIEALSRRWKERALRPS